MLIVIPLTCSTVVRENRRIWTSLCLYHSSPGPFLRVFTALCFFSCKISRNFPPFSVHVIKGTPPLALSYSNSHRHFVPFTPGFSTPCVPPTPCPTALYLTGCPIRWNFTISWKPGRTCFHHACLQLVWTHKIATELTNSVLSRWIVAVHLRWAQKPSKILSSKSELS